MTQGYTTIEQSKKLLSLGLDPSTADMFYATEMGVLVAEPPYEVEGLEPCIPFTPAWSLSALLELMPRTIPHVGILCITPSHKDNGWVVRYDEENISFPTLIDASFELVCWLIEQKHIKVNN